MRLVEAAATIGDLDRAERIAHSVENPDQRAEALAALATADQFRARELLAQAFRSGTWTAPLPAVAVIDPDILPTVVAAFANAVLPSADDLNELPAETSWPRLDDQTKYTFEIIDGSDLFTVLDKRPET